MTDWLSAYRERVNSCLDLTLKTSASATAIPERLQQAMHYGVFNGGKRVRPMLAYMTAEALDCDFAKIDQTAAAIEMIHSYSLIHDDLPAMDDDDLRRGNPTLHIKYDEATAILAGDALQTLAFELIADDESLSYETRTKLIKLIAQRAGPKGMVAGQMIDLEAETKTISEAELENMHQRKTGDLISASVMAGAMISGASDATRQQLQQFGYKLGLAFQVKDDILDYVGDTEIMGKPQGSDIASNKTTFISSLGLEAATSYLAQLHDETIATLDNLGDSAQSLRKLAEFVTSRDH